MKDSPDALLKFRNHFQKVLRLCFQDDRRRGSDDEVLRLGSCSITGVGFQ